MSKNLKKTIFDVSLNFELQSLTWLIAVSHMQTEKGYLIDNAENIFHYI